MRTVFVMILVSIISVAALGQSQAQYDYNNENLRTFDGAVMSVDIVNSQLIVKGVTEMVFPISTQTKFTRDIYDIKLIDVKIGDYVTVNYSNNPDGSIKTLSVVVEYGKGEGW